MNQEIEFFLKHFNEKRQDYQDPKITLKDKTLLIINEEIEKVNLIGMIIISLLGPFIISFTLTQKQFPPSTIIIFIGFGIIWFVVTLYKRIQKIQANNNIKIDMKNKSITIIPMDYLRRNILKMDEQTYSYNSIRSIRTKRRSYDKFNVGLRIILSYKKENIPLVDIWTKQLGTELSNFIQKLINEK